ncbi:MAG: HesA/MoeB/ThiF family protein [Sphingobacteriaceae bacterium]|nr:HesA/MoeB/ThiF family protein [Sphingobacteriaceae bacterium]
MLSKEEIQRYDRQIKLNTVGLEGQLALKNAKILIVGAGGLGCPALQYLAAAGIGNISIMDGDTIGISNLQRQILFSTNELGRSKAIVACEKAKQINPHIHVQAIPKFLDARTALEIFSDHDLILDCTDNFASRYLINDVCTLYKLPFVSAALHKFEGQVGVFNVETENGKYSANYRDIFPESDKSSKSVNCDEAGVLAVLPGMMGLYQANEVIKYFINKKECCVNKVLFINSSSLQHFTLEADLKMHAKRMSIEEILNNTYEVPCALSKTISSAKELFKLTSEKGFHLIDVREINELPEANIEGILKVPLGKIADHAEELRTLSKVIFVCKSGARSKKALEYINTIYPNIDCYSFQPGIETLLNYYKETTPHI